MRLGAPVTSLSLGPAQDMLATSHVGKRGVYLWSNQALFGSGADIVPSEEPVRVRLPALTAGADDGSGAEAARDARGKAAGVEEMLRQTRGAAAAAVRGGDSDEEEDDEEEDEAGDVRQLAAAGASSPDSSDASSDEDEAAAAAAAARRRPAAAADDPALDPAQAMAAAAYAARDGAGAPAPLAPQLVTLSMLPRTQWQNLVHLDTIKVGAHSCGLGLGWVPSWAAPAMPGGFIPPATPSHTPTLYPAPTHPSTQARNKPIEPPKKPAAAPFFLPTLTGADAGRNPVFDFGAGEGEGGGAADPAAEAALAAKAAAAWGDGEEEEERAQDGAVDGSGSDSDEAAGAGASQRQRPPQGRVLHTRAQAEHSQLVRLLHSCARSGDWTSLVAHLRALPPVALDAELRSMQVLPGAPDSELEDLSLLLQFLEEETAANRNFEFTQALLRVVLQVHGGTIGDTPELRARAARAQQRLGAAWRRLDALLQSTRCIVGYLGNLQA